MDVHTQGAWIFPSLIYCSSTETEILHFVTIASGLISFNCGSGDNLCVPGAEPEKWLNNFSRSSWAIQMDGALSKLVEGGIGRLLRFHSNPKHSRIAPESTTSQSWMGLQSRNFKHWIRRNLHGLKALKATLVIHEEFGLFAEPLFAASDLRVFIGVETNLRAVVVSGWGTPKISQFLLKMRLDLCRAPLLLQHLSSPHRFCSSSHAGLSSQICLRFIRQLYLLLNSVQLSSWSSQEFMINNIPCVFHAPISPRFAFCKSQFRACSTDLKSHIYGFRKPKFPQWWWAKHWESSWENISLILITQNQLIVTSSLFFFLTLQSMLHFLRVRGICGINPTVFALPNTPNLFRVNISLPIPTAGSVPKKC